MGCTILNVEPFHLKLDKWLRAFHPQTLYLILFLFQDETNNARVSSWQDHDTSIRIWWHKPAK